MFVRVDSVTDSTIRRPASQELLSTCTRRPLGLSNSPATASAPAKRTGRAEAEDLVDPNEVNEFDRAAETAQAESSWSSYLSLLLGAALAAASATWFFLRVAETAKNRAVS